jgi:hypothetical protein
MTRPPFIRPAGSTRMMRRRGSSLIEMVVCCALFAIFMMVALGLFTGMTRVVHREQEPGERMLEARLAALVVARRLRNCQALVRPTLRELLEGRTAQQLTLREQNRGRTIELAVQDQVLAESYFSTFFDPLDPKDEKPRKALRLCSARSLRISSGGMKHPTRVAVRIDLTDGRTVEVVSNFREAI